MTKLTGEHLLRKLLETEDLGKSDKARACGYVETREDGSQRINFMEFYEAVSDAQSNQGSIETANEDQIADIPDAWQALSENERIQKIMTTEIEKETLEVFGRIDEYKYAVALSENTPQRLLDELSQEGDYFIGQAIIMRCLPMTLRCQDEDKICNAIKSGEVDSRSLADLSKANSWNIREAIANAPNTSADALAIMLEDEDPGIQEIAAKRLLPDELKGLSNTDTAKLILSSQLMNEHVAIAAKAGNWQVRYACYLVENGEGDQYESNESQALAFRCLDAFNGNGDLILGDDQKLILLRSGSAGDADYTITLERVILDDDGDAEDYEQVGYYDSGLESLESAIRDYLENDGAIEDLVNSLPA